MAEDLLSVAGLTKSFGAVTVADDISFGLPEGQALGVIGPNGAGKTSLFNLVTGTLRPDGGTIRFLGQDITASGAAQRCRAGMARSFQVPQPFAAMSVFENVLVGATHGAAMAGSQAEQASLRILELTKLMGRANDPADKLTLLQRKRLELARALSTKPRLLLLDEIAGGLTENECQELVATVNDIRARGTTIVWIEHIVHALMAVAERLLVIDFGRVVADGEPRSVIDSDKVRDIYLGMDPDA